MCGILGVINQNEPVDQALYERMLGALKHRGPEKQGVWRSDNGQVVFGHQRLAIIDLSAGGNQPRKSSDGRFVITFNGEIYNYQELQKELIGYGWHFDSSSDTEVLLCAFMQWKELCLEKLNGMFSFAIWDNRDKVLFAARDRLGEKPFKYFFNSQTFIFASEIKAIVANPIVERRIDWQAIDTALNFRFVAAPETGFAGIHKLPAGHYLIFKPGDAPQVVQYWDAAKLPLDKHADISPNAVWSLFVDSVKMRMVSDVPVGAFLSGGIDSTSIVAAMAEISSKPIHTFVISIDGKSEDQRYANMASKYFGTNHHEIEIDAIDYQAEVSNLVDAYDEPFFDQSALPSLLISRYMKKHVTVVLSGDGGDELFGGYDAYRVLHQFRLFKKFFGRLDLSLLAKYTKSISNNFAYKSEIISRDLISAYTEYYSLWKTLLPISKRYVSKDDLYRSDFKNTIKINASTDLMKRWFESSNSDVVNNAMLADIRGRLADGYLAKIDFATMANAVEVRPPFLDHRLVSLSQQIPSALKIKDGGKFLWKKIVADKIPRAVITRKKTGFAIPLHRIINNQLKDLCQQLILNPQSHISEVFSIDAVKQLWADHNSGKADYSNHLWSLLTLELWINKYIKK